MDPLCVVDRTSLVGLRPLMRRRPGDWYMVLRDGAQPRWCVPGADASVAEVLRSGAVMSLAPRHAGDGGRLRRARAGASRLVLAVGDRAMSEVDDGFVEDLRRALTDPASPMLGKPLAASTTSRTLTVLREAARAWAAGLDIPAGVADRPEGPIRRVGERKERPVPTLYEIGALLAVSSEQLRAAVGLAVGGGLTDGEIRHFQRGQLNVARRRITLFATVPGAPRDRRIVRYAWLPQWAMDLLKAYRSSLSAMPAQVWLFASNVRWVGPCTGFNAALASACKDAWGDDGPRYTMGDLRRSWQALCRAHGMARAVVRRSWWMWAPPLGQRPALPMEARDLQRLTSGWKALGDETGSVLIDPEPVPRQAPNGTQPWQAEPLPRRPADLPASCVV